MRNNKKAQILMENVIFIVLNLIYLTILILFITRAGSGVLNIEESYAKQISLIVDSFEPNTEVYLNMQDAIEIVKEDWGEEHLSGMVVIANNVVTVKLSKDSGYSYSFFSDLNVDMPLVKDDGIIFKVSEK